MSNKNIDLKWAIVSEKTIVDERTNQVSLIGVAEELLITLDKKTIPKDAKTIPFGINLTGYWERQEFSKEEDFSFIVKYIHETNKEELIQTIPLKFQKNMRRMRSIVLVNNIPLSKKSGETRLVIEYIRGGKKIIYYIPLLIKVEINE
ncbi:MAG: hypothetical protein PF572_02685 [Patescibacteria group bacterium]|jgi:hypothetical protein|nr:hypothetical protein [Patescibacteria group bacterium]